MKRKKIMIIVAAIFFICVLIFVSTAMSIYNYGKNAKAKKADCIIILGCSVYGESPSPFLRERLNAGIKVYNEGYAHKIIVSGGKGAGESITEAKAMEKYLTENGISKGDVIMEQSSHSTYENIRNSKYIMDKNDFHSVIIISNRYHLKRAELFCKREGIKSSFTGVYVSKYKGQELKGLMRETLAYLKYFLIG